MAIYTYSDMAANPSTLHTELQAASFVADIDALTTNELTVGGNRNVEVDTSRDLTAGEQTELDGIIAAHTP